MIQQGSKFRLITDYPIAIDSPDHINPYGVLHNNNHSQEFIDKLHELYPKSLSILDLGCAGGHNIMQHNLQGDDACGLEGSDYRKVRNMPEWDKEDNLFTCDITKPFQIEKETSFLSTLPYICGFQSCQGDYNVWWPKQFDCISMWECLEHIHEKDLSQLYINIKNHLKPNGLFLGSICVFDQAKCDRTKGVEWGPSDEYPNGGHGHSHFHHQNMHPREWWWEHFQNNGFKLRTDLVDFFGQNVVRGPGIGAGTDCTVNFYLELK